jgi:hypothetical protein
MFTEDKGPGIIVDEKALDTSSGLQTSESDNDGAFVYERGNMVRDENGRLIVETSELVITALHVDDDPSLSPWTFGTFSLDMSELLACQKLLTFHRSWTFLL